PPQVEEILHKVTPTLKFPLNERQERAFRSSFEERLTLLWGPPGTGKTETLGAIVLGWLELAWECGVPVCIGLGSSNWNAIDNVLKKVADLIESRANVSVPEMPTIIARVRGDHTDPLKDGRVADVNRNSPEAVELLDL